MFGITERELEERIVRRRHVAQSKRVQRSRQDLNGNASEVVRPFLVDGQAKVDPVQLSFVDAAIPVAGIPVTVVRSYDSRRKNERGDFGFGWKLDVKRGTAQHNRIIGDGYAMYTVQGDFTQCSHSFAQKSHFTEIRISEREHYIFTPVISNGYAATGSCEGEVFFDYVDGTLDGATLDIIGGQTETLVRADRCDCFHTSDCPLQLSRLQCRRLSRAWS